MDRGVGAVGPIQEAIPEWLAVIVAVLTQLGDIWFLALLLAVLYWTDTPRREAIATLAGIWVAGIGLYRGLKAVFGFPRPDQPLLDPEGLPIGIQTVYEATALASGYGFPSGHAVNTTIVYFGLASVLSIGTRRLRLIGATAVVTTVSFTRLALGVHFLVDVVAGVAVGALLLVGTRVLIARVGTDPPTLTFGLAVVFTGFFLLTSGVTIDAVGIFAIALGAFGGRMVVGLGR